MLKRGLSAHKILCISTMCGKYSSIASSNLGQVHVWNIINGNSPESWSDLERLCQLMRDRPLATIKENILWLLF